MSIDASKIMKGDYVMGFIDVIKEKAKADKKTIVLPESMDRRTFVAAEKILKEGLANLMPFSSLFTLRGFLFRTSSSELRRRLRQTARAWIFPAPPS